MNTTRRTLLNAFGLAALLPFAARADDTGKPRVEVWKSPTCGCCKDWVAHLEANGFIVKTFDTGNGDMRARLGMPVSYGSCHTARVGGYVLEGHVPASEVQRLLKERPQALGLAVPAMPIGSPGMDGPEYKGRKDAYDVLLVQRDGAASVYRSYR
ncbi:MAG: metal-binding protein [Methyloversatilis sp. 12-65-5]|nr:MAG: metal-binding protein [Methyloversatilis sp. 12-65-5]